MQAGSTLAVLGSRSVARLPAAAAGIVKAAGRNGISIAVGCCVGADRGFLLAALSAQVPVQVFAAFGANGQGSWSGSAVSAVARAVSASAPVTFWAGGSQQVPLKARLLQRSKAVLAAPAVTAAFAVFSGHSRQGGTFKVCQLAASRNLPVFAVSASGSPLPSLGAGRWVPAQLLSVSCWQWQPAQGSLF